tara:strand:- start:51 stop:428 length:378 start_codon:yes stop_codon:yes gene_type:complete
MKRKALNLFGMILFLVACSSTGLFPALRFPNLISERILLESALSEMLNGVGVIVSDYAFINSSNLIIERRPNQTAENQDRNLGRDYLGKPDHFRLWKQGDDCLLEHLETGEMKNVDGLSCVKVKM